MRKINDLIRYNRPYAVLILVAIICGVLSTYVSAIFCMYYAQVVGEENLWILGAIGIVFLALTLALIKDVSKDVTAKVDRIAALFNLHEYYSIRNLKLRMSDRMATLVGIAIAAATAFTSVFMLDADWWAIGLIVLISANIVSQMGFILLLIERYRVITVQKVFELCQPDEVLSL